MKYAKPSFNPAAKLGWIKSFIKTAAFLGIAASATATLADPSRVGPRHDGTGVTPDGWLITPAGQQTPVGPAPLAVASVPGSDLVLVEDAGYVNDVAGDPNHALLVIDVASGEVKQTLSPDPGKPRGSEGYYLGLLVSPDGKSAWASDGAGDALHTYTLNNGMVTEGGRIRLPTGTWPAGIARSPSGDRLYVAGNLADQLLIVDPTGANPAASVSVGHMPYGVALSRDGSRAYVSNWGGTTVTVVDLGSAQVIKDLPAGTHPSGLGHSPVRDELYVAGSDSDEVTVIDTRTSQVLRSISLRPWRNAPMGASPNAIAVSQDGNMLYVANAGDNDIAVIALARPGESRAADRILGLIPTGWYPSGVALDNTGDNLLVINMKALGIGPISPDQYIGDVMRGSLSRIPVPGPDELRDYTSRVWQNNRFADAWEARRQLGQDRRVKREAKPLPERLGEPSAIKYVIYVLKENRTYDQVLGDLDRGNGDPSLTLFGENVTPNHHELARRFVTFDNFYCSGEVSADGWTWSTASNANTYNQKNWPLDYGWSGRRYDFGGFGDSETAAHPGKDSDHPFIWDGAAKHGVSYLNYGFFVNDVPVVVDDSMKGLQGHTVLDYPGWAMDTPDQVRIERWLQDFDAYRRTGKMPTLQLVYLPRDHTNGTDPGSNTPEAMLADNDLALGRLVEAVSRSPFWKNTAIFVVEDDAQDGPDHIDGHRTIAYIISPYTQTGKVDSTLYSTVSMMHTMELILGIDPLTQFDAIAKPMRAAFDEHPNFKPYSALVPGVALTAVNGANAPLARQSTQMDFSKPDAASPKLLNEAIWKSVRGAHSKMPEPRSRAGWSGADD